MPLAVASNSPYRQMGYDGFEDPALNQHFGFARRGVDQTRITDDEAHTGDFSLRVSPGDIAAIRSPLTNQRQELELQILDCAIPEEPPIICPISDKYPGGITVDVNETPFLFYNQVLDPNPGDNPIGTITNVVITDVAITSDDENCLGSFDCEIETNNVNNNFSIGACDDFVSGCSYTVTLLSYDIGDTTYNLSNDCPTIQITFNF